jgi:hypothetical protein
LKKFAYIDSRPQNDPPYSITPLHISKAFNAIQDIQDITYFIFTPLLSGNLVKNMENENEAKNSRFEYGCLMFSATRGSQEARATIGKEIPQKW